MARAIGLLRSEIRSPESRAAVRRRVCAGLASSRPPPAAAPPPAPSRAPAGGDAGSPAGPPRTGNGARRREQHQPSAFRRSPSPPAASPAPRPAQPPAAGAPTAPPPPAAPTGWRLARLRTAGRSAPPRLPSAGGGGGPGGRADAPAPLPPPGPRDGWAPRRSQEALHPSPRGRERLQRGAPRGPLPTRLPGPSALPGREIPKDTAPHSRALNLHSQAGHRGKGGGDTSNVEGQRERDTCLFHRPCLQYIFIPKHTRSFQVFAPLGSVNQSTPNPSWCTQRDQSCACV